MSREWIHWIWGSSRVESSSCNFFFLRRLFLSLFRFCLYCYFCCCLWRCHAALTFFSRQVFSFAFIFPVFVCKYRTKKEWFLGELHNIICLSFLRDFSLFWMYSIAFFRVVRLVLYSIFPGSLIVFF